MKYKLVIFDFDGTLADSFPFFVSVANLLCERFGFKRIEDDELDTVRGYDARRMMQYVGMPLWKMPMVGNAYKAMMQESIDRIAIFPGIDRALQRLSDAGIALAIVTSNSYENVSRVLGAECLSLIQHFECGVAMFGKPAKLRKVLRKTGIAPDEAIYIGDEIRDFEAAKRERIAFGAVAWGYTKFEALDAHGPAERFIAVDEIATTICGAEPRAASGRS